MVYSFFLHNKEQLTDTCFNELYYTLKVTHTIGYIKEIMEYQITGCITENEMAQSRLNELLNKRC